MKHLHSLVSSRSPQPSELDLQPPNTAAPVSAAASIVVHYRAGLLWLSALLEKVVVPIEAIAYIVGGYISTKDYRTLPLSEYVPGR